MWLYILQSHIFNFILHKVALHFAITTLILQLYILQYDCITLIFIKAFFCNCDIISHISYYFKFCLIITF